MAELPSADQFNAATVTEAQFKEAQAKLIDYVAEIGDSVLSTYFANIKHLSGITDYTKTDAEEFELNQLSDVKTDSNLKIISYIKDGVRYYAIPVQLAGGVLVDGEAIDLGNVPNVTQKEFLNIVGDSYDLLDDELNEYELNTSTQYIIIDSNKNILFDIASYNQSLSDIKELRVGSADFKTRISEIENGSQVNPLIPFIQDSKIGVQDLSSDTTSYIEVPHIPTAARQLQLNSVMWDTDDTATPQYFAESPDFKPYPLAPRKVIVGWGHSFLDNARFMQKLTSLTGLNSYNYGKAGLQSTGIAGRHNSPSIAFKTSTGNIPASGSVTLTADYDRNLWYLVAASAVHVTNEQLKGSFAGVDGYVQWDGTNLTFYRETAGDAVTISDYTPFIVAPITTQNSGYSQAGVTYDLHEECINILWIGRNNIGETANIISHYKSIIDSFKTKVKKFVILPEFPASTDTTALSFVRLLNSTLASTFPEYYCQIDGVDALTNFNNHLNPNFADDVADVAAGFTPRTLRYDSLHPSQTIATSLSPSNALYVGADVNAEFVYQFLTKKGWI